MNAAHIRLMAAVAAERRLIQRNPHDGAQQGLVAAAGALGLARGPDDHRRVLAVLAYPGGRPE